MNVILVMVTTVNGKITRGEDSDIYSWTSKEDQDFFFSLLQKYALSVMGSGTYDAIRENIKPQPNRRRIILTSHPSKYQSEEVQGQVEFVNSSPHDLITRLRSEEYEEILLVGGGETNKAFFEAGLVTEIFLTVEPRLFGAGKQFISEGSYENELELVSQKQLNRQGTLLLHYKIKTL